MMKLALVTGSNSGLGFEAAKQLADSGKYEAIYLACRTQEKCDVAAAELAKLCGKPKSLFPAMVVSVSGQASVKSAVENLDLAGKRFSDVIFNAGGVGPKSITLTEDGIEMTMAASLAGHHSLFCLLYGSGFLEDDAHVVMVSSEASRGDVKAFAKMKPVDFRAMAKKSGSVTHESLISAITLALKGEKPYKYEFQAAYATTKELSNFWTAAVARKMSEKHPNMVVVAVSPGSSVDTAALKKMPEPYRTIMKYAGKRLFKLAGASMPVDVAAKRYIDALSFGVESSGDFFASKPKKITGPMVKQTHPYYIKEKNKDLQEATFDAVSALVNVTL